MQQLSGYIALHEQDFSTLWMHHTMLDKTSGRNIERESFWIARSKVVVGHMLMLA